MPEDAQQPVMFGALRCSAAITRQPAFSEKLVPSGLFEVYPDPEVAKQYFRECLWAEQEREKRDGGLYVRGLNELLFGYRFEQTGESPN